METFWAKLYDAFHVPESRTYRRVQPVIWGLIVFSILLFALEFILDGAVWITVIDWVVLVLFAVELVLRVATHRPKNLDFFSHTPSQRLRVHLMGRLRYALRPLNLVDLVTVLALVPALRGLRALRLLRLVRTSKIFRYSQPFEGLLRAFQENGLLFAFGGSLFGTATIVGGLSIYLVERGHNDHILTLADGLWWALVTLTTVGYGDISPMTPLGRVVGVALMSSGVFIVAVFTAITVYSLIGAVLTLRAEQYHMSPIINHIVVCGYDQGAKMLIDELLNELEDDAREVVICANRERPLDVPPRFMWIQADFTKESELDKIRLAYASAIILVGSRAVTPQQADAMTILAAFTIRAFLDKHVDNKRRAQPLYIVAEILDAENVAHARAAGADEVIETTRLGFSLMAHAVSQPGTAAVMSQFASFGAHSLYIIDCDAEAPILFKTLAARFKRDHSVLVVGLHHPVTGEEFINPHDDFRVEPHMQIFYLAECPIAPPKPDD